MVSACYLRRPTVVPRGSQQVLVQGPRLVRVFVQLQLQARGYAVSAHDNKISSQHDAQT